MVIRIKKQAIRRIQLNNRYFYEIICLQKKMQHAKTLGQQGSKEGGGIDKHAGIASLHCLKGGMLISRVLGMERISD